MGLVGTKADLRNDTETQAQLRQKNLSMVAKDSITNMVSEVNAVKYLECSALTQEGLKSVFDEAIRAALYKPSKDAERVRPPVETSNKLLANSSKFNDFFSWIVSEGDK